MISLADVFDLEATLSLISPESLSLGIFREFDRGEVKPGNRQNFLFFEVQDSSSDKISATMNSLNAHNAQDGPNAHISQYDRGVMSGGIWEISVLYVVQEAEADGADEHFVRDGDDVEALRDERAGDARVEKYYWVEG